MSKFETPNYVIVLGTTFSGSGAVFDYLKGRGDLYDPLEGEEYLLPILPNGLMALEAASEMAFDPATSEYCLKQFEYISNKLSNFWLNGPQKKKLKKFVPLFNKHISEFIKDISTANYPMRILWRELLKTPIEKNFNKIQNIFGIKQLNPQTRLLVTQKKFIEAVIKMHENLFSLNSDNRPIMLNQAGSGWNPTESTKYFKNHKILLITRDPRDQYLEISHFKKGYSIMGFIDWYKEMQNRLKMIRNENILKIRFEDFVNDNENYQNIICNFLKISNKVNSDYKVNLSKKNIGKFKDKENKNKIQLIENHLKDFLYI